MLGAFGPQIGPPDRFDRPAGRASRSTGPAHPLRGPRLTHDGERPSVIVFEESHPFLRAVFVAMNHMWRMGEFDPPCTQGRVGAADIRYAKIKDRSEEHTSELQ